MRHDLQVPLTSSDPATTVGHRATTLPPEPAPLVSRCPGCGAVLGARPDLESRHPGASPACTRLFDVTVRGLRDEASSDQRAAAVLQLATDAYDAQHVQDDDRDDALTRLRAGLGEQPGPGATPPAHWTTTVADVAADLDVVDLISLVRSWARAVSADWAAADWTVADWTVADTARAD